MQAYQIKLVLLSYRLFGATLLVSPILLAALPTLAYRNEMLAVLYLILFLTLVAKAYLLGGGLDIHLSTQINQNYALKLNQLGKPYIDLHCLSLLRVFGIWLAFPAAWLRIISNNQQLFDVYESNIEHYLNARFADK